MHPLTPSTITWMILVPLMAWRIYSRFRRLIGKQRLSKVRPWITLVIFTALITLLGYSAFLHVERLYWLALGIGSGLLLGIYGLKQTKFEVAPQRLFYTPDARLGVTLFIIFFVRVLYRLLQMFVLVPTLPHTLETFGGNALTLAVFGLLAGYNICYAIGLIRWRFRFFAERALREKY